MRAIEPLLAYLVARHPEPADVEELARVVWGQRPSRSVVGAITTSIARLRTLLGPAAPVLTRGEGLQRAYVLAPAARVWRIDAIGAATARDSVF
jgi:DNA-binding SARP family transcriptional activator